jgi:hypothetical protein
VTLFNTFLAGIETMNMRRVIGNLCVLTAAIAVATEAAAAADKGPDPYYTQPRFFFPHPDSRGPTWKVPNFGPVGIGIDLVRPGMTMKISRVEEGSPAAKTGKLKAGQIIERVNGQVLKDRDPREILGDWITEAEATDGKVVLAIKDLGDVVVQIPVLGRYADTWPVNCKKSDQIVRNLADAIARQKQPRWGSIMFLLSTGDDKDLDVVKGWIKDVKTSGPYPWHKGYVGVELCEYYLRTGDASILPVIAKDAEAIKGFMYNDGWSGRGRASYTYGQLNAAGVHCLTFVLMAKLCGVDVDEQMLQSALKHFYRYAGRGSVPYGDSLPENGFRDNGKTGGLAVAMAAAALLTPDGEKTVYAKARDNTAMKGFYANNWFHAAHTGGGIGEIWHNTTVSMMREKRPGPYRSFLDSRRWVMELSRRHDGSIGIAGVADRYDKSVSEEEIAWGNYFALTYTIPRKHLQLYGAPRSKYAKTFELPVRPWGNAADDVFQSPEPIPGSSMTMDALLAEKADTDASAPIMASWGKGTLTDETILKYLHHPEYDYRIAMVNQVVKRGRGDIVLAMLKPSDPRLRKNGLVAMTGVFKTAALPDEEITPAMVSAVERMVEDPEEAWWVKLGAIAALERGGPEAVAKHKATLLSFLSHDDWWFQTAAAHALLLIATEPEHYKDVIPPIAAMLGKTKILRVIHVGRDVAKVLPKAPPEIQKFAAGYFREASVGLPAQFVDDHTGYVMTGGSTLARNTLTGIVTKLPGGAELGRADPKTTLAWRNSNEDKDLYVYTGTFKPNPPLVGKWRYITDVADGTDPVGIEKAVKKRASYLDWVAKQLEKKAAAQASKKGDDKKKKKKKKGGPLERALVPVYLELKDKGEVGQNKVLFWTDDMLIDNGLGEARRMELHAVNGKTYLLVEKGGFAEDESASKSGDGGDDTGDDSEDVDEGEDADSGTREPADTAKTADDNAVDPAPWHCGYKVYERVE